MKGTPWRVLMVAMLAACGAPQATPAPDPGAGPCVQQRSTGTPGVKNLATLVVLVPGRATIAPSALQAIAEDDGFKGVGTVATYGAADRYRVLNRVAVTGEGNSFYKPRQQALARQCLASTDLGGLPEGVHGDALTAVALAFESERRDGGEDSPIRVVVYGAGTLVTSGLDLARTDLSGPEQIDGVVRALDDNGLLRIAGGSRSSLVFAGLSEDAANAVAARQREELFQRICGAVAVAECATSLGVST